jgi:protein TonB
LPFRQACDISFVIDCTTCSFLKELAMRRHFAALLAAAVLGAGFAGAQEKTEPPPKPPVKRLRQGGQVAAANIIKRVQPKYPHKARDAGIQGIVKLHVIIGKDGSVSQLDAISGHPLLVKAAIDAVRQWKYRPTLLNGEPVEVDTTVDIIFTLN